MKTNLQLAADFLFPPVCAFCHQLCQPDIKLPSICRSCLASLPLRLAKQMKLMFSYQPCNANLSLYAAAFYQPPLRQALLKMKFSDAPELAVALAGILRMCLKTLGLCPGAVAAVPLHQGRQAERGYNQAGLLARLLADWLELPDISAFLIRNRPTYRQSELDSRQARLLNVKDAFSLEKDFTRLLDKDYPSLGQKNVLLVDDVLTTGATLTAAARALNMAGFKVDGLVVASDHMT